MEVDQSVQAGLLGALGVRCPVGLGYGEASEPPADPRGAPQAAPGRAGSGAEALAHGSRPVGGTWLAASGTRPVATGARGGRGLRWAAGHGPILPSACDSARVQPAPN